MNNNITPKEKKRIIAKGSGLYRKDISNVVLGKALSIREDFSLAFSKNLFFNFWKEFKDFPQYFTTNVDGYLVPKGIVEMIDLYEKAAKENVNTFFLKKIKNLELSLRQAEEFGVDYIIVIQGLTDENSILLKGARGIVSGESIPAEKLEEFVNKGVMTQFIPMVSGVRDDISEVRKQNGKIIELDSNLGRVYILENQNNQSSVAC